MAILGFGDMKLTALHALWDSAEMTKIRLQEGTTFEQMINDVQSALGLVNSSLLSMAHYSSLISIQDTLEVEYPIGVPNGVEESTEYSTPTPKQGNTTGHNIPLRSYDRALGWTYLYMRKARMTKLDADVRSAMSDITNDWQQRILTRLFKMEGETVGTTSNSSVPLADGGTTDSKYVPMNSPEGEVFTSSHDHFLRHATISNANLTIALEHLQEHGHESPFDIIASRADASSWSGIDSGFKNPEWAGIVYKASATERAQETDISNYFGYIETDYGIARIWLTPRVPTNYYSVYKSYGQGDARSPVRVRLDPGWGFGWAIVPGVWVNAPQLLGVMYTEYGFGIGEDRTNGVCVEIDASGDYATPTIS